jgi:hypothetical protein
VSLIVDADEETSRSAEDEAVLLTGQAYRGGVYDGHEFDYIL